MSIPVLTTKFLVPPRRLDWVIRPRLTRRLDQGLQRRLTLISAPAGFGKTTLVASWLHGLANRQHIAPRVGWLSLEEDDNDLVRFLSYFIAAWQTIDAEVGQTTRQLLEMPRVPHPHHLMTLLINDLARLSKQSILVLDDYHVINHPELQKAVAFFLDHLPPHCQVVMATREEPALPLPRLRARSEVLEIRLQDLRFTREETAAFLKRTMGLALTADEAQALENHTEGWIAGLQMAALSLRGRPESSGSDTASLEIDGFGGGHRDIIDYLAVEVLRQQSPEICAFLRQTAILDRFNASLCTGVTGHLDSAGMLAHLERANLFLIPLDDQRQWYRYHHLFADYLRTELSDSDQRNLHGKASRWHEANGFMPEAIKHALAARDYVTAVRLIRLGAEDACIAGKYNTLLGWVNALPEKVVRAHSDLLVHKGWILYLRGEIVTGEAYAALAVENQRPDDLPLYRGMLLGFRAYLAINRDQPQQAVKFAQEALTLLDETESFYRTTALSHLGQAERLTGDRQAAIHSLRQTIALGQRLGHHLPVLEALGYLTLLLNQQGKLREAILSCEQAASRFMDVQGHPVPVAGLVYVPLGTLYYEMNDLVKAYHYLTTGIALCQQMGTVYYALVGQRALAKLYYAQGDVEAMWETLAAARELATNSENSRRIRRISAVTAELQLRQGITAAAVHTLVDLPVELGKRTEQENLTYARLLLAQGQSQAALELLKEIEQSAQQRGRLSSLISIYLLQSLTHQVLNDTSAALDCLERALCLAAPEGYRRVFLDEGQPVAALLAQRQHVAPAFVTSLLKAFAKHPANETVITVPTPHITAQPLVEPLSETQLNILRLVAAGLSNRDIAARLAITEGTTKWHLNQVYGKLNVCSRTQAVAQARQRRLI